MKIKNNPFTLLIVVMMFITMILPALLFAQSEIPITTSSKEARKLFIQGRDKLENIEGVLAAEFFNKAIALDPDFAMAYLLRSQTGQGAAAARENREKALSLADKVSEGERTWILMAQATADGNFVSRKENLDHLMQLFPRDKRVLTAMGMYYSNQLSPDAVFFYKKAIEIDKNYGPAHNMLGYAYMQGANWDEAEKAFKRYMEVTPNSPNPIDSYAEMLLRSGRYDEAISYYKKAYEKSPAFINAFTGMGTCYIHKGDFSGAREVYKQQLEKALNVSWRITALSNMFMSWLHEGRPAEALKGIEELRTLCEKENQTGPLINTYAFAGWVNLESGDLSRAAKNFERARALTSKSDLPASIREGNQLNRMIERTILLINVMEFETAESLIKECKQLIEKRKNPNEAKNFNVTLGILERQKGNYEKALESFANANTSEPYTLYQMALTYEMKGDGEMARKTYEKVVNWNWNSFQYALVRHSARQKASMNVGSILK